MSDHEKPLTDKELKFIRALRAQLKADALAYQIKDEGPAGNVIFPRPKPLLYDYFAK